MRQERDPVERVKKLMLARGADAAELKRIEKEARAVALGRGVWGGSRGRGLRGGASGSWGRGCWARRVLGERKGLGI